MEVTLPLPPTAGLNVAVSALAGCIQNARNGIKKVRVSIAEIILVEHFISAYPPISKDFGENKSLGYFQRIGLFKNYEFCTNAQRGDPPRRIWEREGNAGIHFHWRNCCRGGIVPRQGCPNAALGAIGGGLQHQKRRKWISLEEKREGNCGNGDRVPLKVENEYGIMEDFFGAP